MRPSVALFVSFYQRYVCMFSVTSLLWWCVYWHEGQTIQSIHQFPMDKIKSRPTFFSCSRSVRHNRKKRLSHLTLNCCWLKSDNQSDCSYTNLAWCLHPVWGECFQPLGLCGWSSCCGGTEEPPTSVYRSPGSEVLEDPCPALKTKTNIELFRSENQVNESHNVKNSKIEIVNI